MKKLLWCIFLFLFCLACTKIDLLEDSLSLAGENRRELEKVLDYYKQNPKDSLKYTAACFLIENMIWYSSQTGEKMDWYHKKVDSLFSDTTLNIDLWRKGMDSILVQLKDRKGIKRQMDIQNISSDFLISHIEGAFKTLEYPWNKDINFKDFCEYILPYRVGNTSLQHWRPEYNRTFSFAIDSLIKGNASDSAVCEYFAHLYRYITYDTKNYKPSNLPLNLLKLRTGDCVDYTELGVYLARTFGIPLSIDFTPQWANGSNRHQWNRWIRNDKSREIAFMNAEYYPLSDSIPHLERARRYANRKLAKVYRKTYSANPKSLALRQGEENIPLFFKEPFFKDVSSDYFEGVDVAIKLEIDAPIPKKFAYIMVFDNQNWQPIDWAEIKKDKAIFRDMGKDVAYIVMYYHENKYYPASYPFYVDTLGVVKELKPNLDESQQVRLTRKFHDKVVKFRLDQVTGDKLQVANKRDFSDVVDLYVLDSIPEAKFHTIYPKTNQKFRYFRYRSEPLYSEDSLEIISHFYGNVAEIELYNEKDEKINGKVIGTPDSLTIWGRFTASNVFDGNELTYFETRDSIIGWAGLAFNKPETISKIIYLPRNDDNFIREGEEYELYYWNKGWNSLGKRTGDHSQELIYKHVPKDALFLLKNHTKGKEERIFTYENDRQVWW